MQEINEDLINIRPPVRRRRHRRSNLIIPIGILILVIISVAFIWKLISGNNIQDVTVEVGTSVSMEDFLVGNSIFPTAMQTDLESLDLSKPGDYPISIFHAGFSHSAVLHVKDTVKPTATVRDITVYSDKLPEASEFVTDIIDVTEVTVSYLTPPVAATTGQQELTIVLTDLGGNVTEYPVTLSFAVDYTPPEIVGVKNLTVYLGQRTDLLAGVTAKDDEDSKVKVTVEDASLNIYEAGRYQITYVAVNSAGLETVQTCVVTVVEDSLAPELLGVRPLSMFVGGTVAYRSNVIVRDNMDSAPSLQVDSSAVDLSKPGTYPVIYTATDAAGNKTVLETTITVAPQPDTYVEIDVINAAADRVLATIITDDMTTMQQIRAIYDWVHDSCWYVSTSDKTDWQQEAYKMLTEHYGDCFGYYAVSRLMFERLGIPNLTIQRKPNTDRPSTHYWSMISLDGGATYYHYDSCPHDPAFALDSCLMTDKIVQEYTALRPGYYYYDTTLYPATPEELPQ